MMSERKAPASEAIPTARTSAPAACPRCAAWRQGERPCRTARRGGAQAREWQRNESWNSMTAGSVQPWEPAK